jgi:hypothetical protein
MAFVKAECKNVFIKLGIYGIVGIGGGLLGWATSAGSVTYDF